MVFYLGYLKDTVQSLETTRSRSNVVLIRFGLGVRGGSVDWAQRGRGTPSQAKVKKKKEREEIEMNIRLSPRAETPALIRVPTPAWLSLATCSLASLDASEVAWLRLSDTKLAALEIEVWAQGRERIDVSADALQEERKGGPPWWIPLLKR